MEEVLYDTPLLREFARLDIGAERLPDESTILRFRHLLEEHDLAAQIFGRVNAILAERGLLLKTGTAVDATLIAAPSSTKNASGLRDPEMHQTKKGGQWYFGMKAHIGVDADSGLVHTLTTAANAHDITEAAALLHGAEEEVFADSGYRGAERREEVSERHPTARWNIAMMPSRLKAGIRAKVEHPFRVLKCQFGYRKVRYRGLAKNTAQLQTLCALSNLWMVRKRILQRARA